MTPIQCKMARAALGLSSDEFHKKSKVAFMTVSRFENGKNINIDNLKKMETALEEMGITFISQDEVSLNGGTGIRVDEKKGEDDE